MEEQKEAVSLSLNFPISPRIWLEPSGSTFVAGSASGWAPFTSKSVRSAKPWIRSQSSCAVLWSCSELSKLCRDPSR
jgi:hypothetical protein